MTRRSPPKKKASFVDVDEDAEAAASSAPTNGSFGGYQVIPNSQYHAYIAASDPPGGLNLSKRESSANQYTC